MTMVACSFCSDCGAFVRLSRVHQGHTGSLDSPLHMPLQSALLIISKLTPVAFAGFFFIVNFQTVVDLSNHY